MRERTTWSRSVIAADKKADDPRAMNQDHLKQQPAADAYVTGTPSDFAEDVAPSNWKAEYSGGEVKRNEIGQPEMRPETFNHSEKTAAQQAEEELEKKANLCIKYASLVLPKTASERMLEDQALAFMHLPDAVLIDSYNRLASQDQGQQQDQGKQAQDQQQAQQEGKQAGEVPPQFLENMKKKEDGDDKGQDKKQAQDQSQDQGQGQQQEGKQAGEVPPQFLENMKKKEDGGDDKGQDKKQAQDQGQQQSGDEQKKQAADKLAALARAACDAMQQGDMALAQQQIQQMVQQAQGGQPQQMMSQQQMDQIQQMVQQAMQQQAPAPQQQAPVMASDDALLNDMLNADVSARPVMASAGAASMDIELQGAEMDVGGTHLASDDEALTALFASSPEVQEAAHAYALQTGTPVTASAGMTRTAATRTVGTRPSGGVASLGGAAPATSGGGDVEKLAGLWQSAPDIKNLF
jgi:hypothetical protein